jgi:hypothetical protein
MINHMITYRVVYTAYFADNVKPFLDTSSVLEEVSLYQPITKKIVIFKDVVSAPFDIIKDFLGQEMHTMSRSISNKFGQSSFKDDRAIVSHVIFAIQTLIQSKEFNDALRIGLTKDKKGYLEKIWNEVAKDQQFNESEIFRQAQGCEFTDLQRILIAHMVLITKYFYEIDLKDFQHAADDKHQFANSIRICLPPEQKTYLVPLFRVQEQGLTDGDFKELGAKDHVGCCTDSKCVIM